MRKTLLAVVVSLFAILQCAQAEEPEYLGKLFPGCGPARCVIKFNLGGRLGQFNAALDQMVERRVRLIVIDGPCGSSCASVVDRARGKGIDACLTPVGKLGFHKGTNYKTDTNGDILFDTNGEGIRDHYFNPPQTRMVRRWIEKRHGFPVATKFEDELHMDASNARGAFRVCGPEDIRKIQ